MKPIHTRVAVVILGFILAFVLAVLGKQFFSDESYFQDLEAAFRLLFAALLAVGGPVLIHAAVFGSEDDIFRFSRPPGIFILSFKMNVLLIRMALFAMGLVFLIWGISDLAFYLQ